MDTSKPQTPPQTTNNPTINLTTLTGAISDSARRAHTPDQRYQLYQLVTELGRRIATREQGFDQAEFLKQCGVRPDWAEQAA